MAADTDRLIRTMLEVVDGDASRPKPGAAFFSAVAEYADASRRFAAARRALLVQVERFEATVRMANGEAGDASGDAFGDAPEHAPEIAPWDAVAPGAAHAPRRASRGVPAGCAVQPGHRAARRPGRLDRRG